LGVFFVVGCQTPVKKDEYSNGGDWNFYGTSPDGEFFYDSKSICSQENNIVRVVSKIVFSERGEIGLIKEYGKVQESVTHYSFIYEFNCKDKKYRTLEYSIWSGENLSLGPIPILRGGPIDSGWRSFARGSPGESLYKAVCK
jgi:hypothetical protein